MTTPRRLEKRDDRSRFSCGDYSLDEFLQKRARQHQRKKVSATYVIVDAPRILAFVTVAAGTIEWDEMNIRNLPQYPLPMLLLARLGVDTSAKGQGLGSRLVKHALELAKEMSISVGCVGVVVDAKLKAVSFYEGLGFRVLSTVSPAASDTRKLFIPVTAIP